MHSKKVTRLTNAGGIDYFFFNNESIYYMKSSSLYRMSMDGSLPEKVSKTLLDEGDQTYRYYFGGFNMIEGGPDFPLMRKPWPSTGETYIESEDKDSDYYEESDREIREQISTFDVQYSDYLGSISSDTFVFTERDSQTDISYFHLINKNIDTIRSIRNWIIDPLDIVHGWVFFSARNEEWDQVGIFAIRPDGSGLQQIGNNEYAFSDYLGSIKQNLVFKDRNDGSFILVKEPDS